MNKQDIKLEINGLNLIIKNKFFKVYIYNSYVIKILVDNVNLINNLNGKKTFYLDWNGGKFIFKPKNLFVLKYSNNIIHVMYNMFLYDKCEIQYHYIFKNNLFGIYNYVVINNLNINISYKFSEIRTVYRFDYEIMNMLYNGLLIHKSYLYNFLNKQILVQDETWQLKDGTYYSKYDLAGYIRDTNFYGIYGNKYGAWIMNFSNEYFSGGPLKQDLLVHQDSLILNYLNSTHFGTKELIIPKYKWSKMYGPWLIYFNKGKDINLISDANMFFNIEKNNWPFNWINDKNYPIIRSTLKGKLKNVKNLYKIVLCSSINEEFDFQTLGYLYNTNSLNDGTFIIKNIRPNIYNLYIYPINGYDCNFLFKKKINIKYNLNLGILDINENLLNKKLIWNIGETNRKSDKFKYSSKNRNYIWHTLVPSNINFYIYKKNNIKKNWYYAQTKRGKWNIYFYDKIDNKNRILNIGISGVSSNILEKNINKPKLEIYLNNILLNVLSYENDKSIYRGALNSGNFYSKKIFISKKLIINNINILTLKLLSGSFMYDTINYLYE